MVLCPSAELDPRPLPVPGCQHPAHPREGRHGQHQCQGRLQILGFDLTKNVVKKKIKSLLINFLEIDPTRTRIYSVRLVLFYIFCSSFSALSLLLSSNASWTLSAEPVLLFMTSIPLFGLSSMTCSDLQNYREVWFTTLLDFSDKESVVLTHMYLWLACLLPSSCWHSPLKDRSYQPECTAVYLRLHSLTYMFDLDCFFLLGLGFIIHTPHVPSQIMKWNDLIWIWLMQCFQLIGCWISSIFHPLIIHPLIIHIHPSLIHPSFYPSSFFPWLQVEVTRGLVMLAMEKLAHDIPELLYDDVMFSHFVDEVLLFDRELRLSYNYPVKLPGCLHVLITEEAFNKWLMVERKCELRRR